MHELIEKKLKKEKILRYIVIVYTILLVVSLFFIPAMDSKYIAMILFCSIPLWVIGIIYLVYPFQFMRKIKWLSKTGMENIFDDIVLERPTLPRSKIYCGNKAFFSKASSVIIPYSEIAWVYMHEKQVYGFTVEKNFIINCKDGKKFTVHANVDEFKWLLENYISKHSPNLIVGFGAEQKKQYLQQNPKATESGNLAKTIWGVILLAFAAFLLIMGLINGNIEVGGIIVLSGLIVGGIVLLLMGRKK